MKKNVASQVVGAQMVTAADGTAFTGSVTAVVTGDGGTQGGGGACTHEGNGYHTYTPSQAETNYDLVAFTFTGTGAVPQTVQIYTTPATGILAPATAGRTLAVEADGMAHADVKEWLATAVTLSTNNKPDVNVDEWHDVALATTNPLPNAAADAAGGLPISDAGGLDLDAKLANTNEVTAARMAALTDWIDGGRLDLILDARASQATADAIEADTQDIQSKIGTPTDLDGGGATLAGNTTDIINYVDTVGQAIVADTQDIQSRIPAALVGGRMDATVDGTGMETGAIDAIWTRALTEAYAADGATFTGAQALYMIYALLAEASASGTTLTIKKLDGSTTAMTFTLNDASTPTSITRSG